MRISLMVPLRWQGTIRSVSRNTESIVIKIIVLNTFLISFLLFFDIRIDISDLSIEPNCPEDSVMEVEVKEHGTTVHNRRKNPLIKQHPTVFKRTDNFTDLVVYLKTRNLLVPASHEYVLISEAVDHYNPTIAALKNRTINNNATNLLKFQWSISRQHIYKPDDPVISDLLHDLATLPIIGAKEIKGRTDIKITLKFPQHMYGVFKPMRYPRDHQTDENHFHFQDFERHYAEIAAYHLDKALGFYRTVPVVGRKIHLITDLKQITDDNLSNTFFISSSNNTCFYGTCRKYCDVFHPICGNPVWLEGSVTAYMPQFSAGERKLQENPWKRSHSVYHKAEWEDDPNYCDEVLEDEEYSNGRLLFDIIDTAVFDFLSGNADRHSFETFQLFGNNSSPILYNNGRGFGRAYYDDYLILAPLTQCCIIRRSTVKQLLQFQNGPKRLSEVMTESMANDPVAPVLWKPHLIALDRRVELILHEIRKCIMNMDSEESMTVYYSKVKLKDLFL